MINAKELRIGNYIMYNPPQGSLQGPFIITEINSEWVGYEKGNGVSELFIDQPRLPLLWCEPISIVEEWLMKLGFERRMMNVVVPEWYIMCTPPNYKREFSLWFRFGCMVNTPRGVCDGQGWHPWMDSGDAHGFNIKSIHHLQNFYYGFTGQELTLIQ